MNQSADESRLHELVVRLKHDDEEHAPSFDDVMGRPEKKAEAMAANRLSLAIVCCVAATLLGAMLFVWSQRGDVPSSAQPNDIGFDDRGESNQDRSPPQQVAEIDFDHLRRVVEEHYRTAEKTDVTRVPVWSSPTESLLAWSHDASLSEE